jgi:D-cysteine desulfhydrase
MKIDVSQSPWWWIRVLSPGAVETIDVYSRSEPTVGREIAIDRSIPACWPTVVWRSAGVILVAIDPMIGRVRSPPMVDLPRFPLLDSPSPLHPLPRFSAALAGSPVEVWIKREDLLPIGLGGNKLRNLEFLLGAALAEGADTLVTSGRRWSNHARLTAAAGARAGLGVHLVLSGPPVAGAGSPVGRLAELFGAVVHQLPTADRGEREAAVARVVGELRDAGRRPYLIGVGGSGVIGAFGQVLAAREALEQAGAFDELVLPSATGGTQAGLLVGLRGGGAATTVRGVAVARPPEELRGLVETTVSALGDLEGLARVRLDEVVVDASQLGPGYGRRTEAAEEATRLLARTEGILVDPIYTAKALAGLIAAIEQGTLAGPRALFWHAGGLPGLFEPLD